MTKAEIAREKIEKLTEGHGLARDMYEALLAIVDAIEAPPGEQPDPEHAHQPRKE